MKTLLITILAASLTVAGYSSDDRYPLTIEVSSAITATGDAVGFGTCQEPGTLPHLCNNAKHTNTYVLLGVTMDGTDYQFACRDSFHRCPMLQPHRTYRARWVKNGRGIEIQEPKSTFWTVAAGQGSK